MRAHGPTRPDTAVGPIPYVERTNTPHQSTRKFSTGRKKKLSEHTKIMEVEKAVLADAIIASIGKRMMMNEIG